MAEKKGKADMDKNKCKADSTLASFADCDMQPTKSCFTAFHKASIVLGITVHMTENRSVAMR